MPQPFPRISLTILGTLAAFLLPALLTEASAEWVSVSKPSANIRAEPRMSTDVLWRDKQYTPYKVVARFGHWVQVRTVDDHMGWIHRGLLSSVPAVIVKVEYADIYPDSDPDTPPLRRVPLLSAFKLVLSKGDWLYVEDAKGVKSWIKTDTVWGNLDFELRDAKASDPYRILARN